MPPKPAADPFTVKLTYLPNDGFCSRPRNFALEDARERAKAAVAAMPPERFYAEVGGIAEVHGKSPEWAAHRFKDQHGRYPPRAWNDQPAEVPCDDVENWIGMRVTAYVEQKQREDREDYC